MSRVRQDAELQDGAVAAREDAHGGQALPVHRVLLQVQPELRPQDAPEVRGPPCGGTPLTLSYLQNNVFIEGF